MATVGAPMGMLRRRKARAIIEMPKMIANTPRRASTYQLRASIGNIAYLLLLFVPIPILQSNGITDRGAINARHTTNPVWPVARMGNNIAP